MTDSGHCKKVRDLHVSRREKTASNGVTFSSRSSVNACSQFTSCCEAAFPADFFPFDIALFSLKGLRQ